jgi:murein L,D-transpeptidase YcbB/YkuD
MSNSSLVDYIKISPHKNSPRNHKIDTITIHCVVGQLSVESLGGVFQGTRKASSNYGIGYDGRIGMYVEERDRSMATSSRSNDNRAITIEVASDTTHPYKVTKAAYNSLIKLLADICKRNDIEELKWKGDKSLKGKVDKQNMTVHRWFANKACPGDYLYNLHGQIASEVNAILNKSATTTENESAYTLKEFIKDVQSSCGASVDGIAGPETLSKTVTLSSKKNNKHKAVRFVQKRLLELGYSEIGVIDGIAGSKFTSAVKRFQKDNGCVADGEITARKKTWEKLLGML